MSPARDRLPKPGAVLYSNVIYWYYNCYVVLNNRHYKHCVCFARVRHLNTSDRTQRSEGKCAGARLRVVCLCSEANRRHGTAPSGAFIDSGNRVAPRGGEGRATVPGRGWRTVDSDKGGVRVHPRHGEAEKEAGRCCNVYIISQSHLKLKNHNRAEKEAGLSLTASC